MNRDFASVSFGTRSDISDCIVSIFTLDEEIKGVTKVRDTINVLKT